jgi:hypothetical protein
MTRTTRRKWHYAGPRMSTTLCGIGLNGPKNPWLVPKTEEVTCLLCINALTEPWHGSPGGYRNHAPALRRTLSTSPTGGPPTKDWNRPTTGSTPTTCSAAGAGSAKRSTAWRP